MTDERRHIRFISETKNSEPCRVNPIHVRKEVQRMERAGWALVSREPADESVPAMEVMLIFQKGEE
jgi:hypothetical protein